MSKTVVAVLFGGCSTEYEVSLQSAYAVLTHLDARRYSVLTVGITRQGEWLYYNGALEKIQDGTWCEDPLFCNSCALSPDKGKRELIVFGDHQMCFPFDVLFPVLHGKNGEDGTVQGLAELAGIPLVGCGTLASSLCMDKARAHTLARAVGIEVPMGMVFEREDAFSKIEQEAEKIGWPLFVKPVRAGSSFGITRVEEKKQLKQAVQNAFEHDDQILLEQAVDGFEVGCAVLGNHTLTVGLVDEIELSAGFFDYEEKYTLKSSKIHCPARISAQDAIRVQETAKILYRTMGCRGFARVDLFFTPDRRIVFNEINTIPGFTSHSRYPNMMRGIGLNFDELLEKLVDLGLEE
ncbi:D-alanine--D-serine ligase VanG [uncultured Ruthenibacterium sp.]|uniref:D-alanine--D-serine ligase VanG n=1 Tax=uncultured Ruthenibacterium sp. TaxID=1905347 RepID=UPI00349EC75C